MRCFPLELYTIATFREFRRYIYMCVCACVCVCVCEKAKEILTTWTVSFWIRGRNITVTVKLNWIYTKTRSIKWNDFDFLNWIKNERAKITNCNQFRHPYLTRLTFHYFIGFAKRACSGLRLPSVLCMCLERINIRLLECIYDLPWVDVYIN